MNVSKTKSILGVWCFLPAALIVILVYSEAEREIWMDLATFFRVLHAGIASIRPYFKFMYQSIINNELRQVLTWYNIFVELLLLLI